MPPDRGAADRVLDLIGSAWITQAVGAMAELRLADALAAAPRDAAALAAELGCDADALERLLQALVSLELCTTRGDGCYTLTPLGALLGEGVAGSLRHWALWWSRHLWPLWGDLAGSVRSGHSARARLSGQAGYEHLQHDPMAACTFHAAMGELTSLVAALLAERMRFASGALLADLGGGNGELLVGILAADASLRGLLFEMPHALADAQARIAAAGMQARIAVQGGDFFESVPAADVYLLKSVLHNWDDEHCIRLLARCRAAMGPPARLVVIERVRPAQPATGAPARALARNDLNMLIGPGGRERSAAALERLFAAAGLRQVSAVALAHGLTALDLRAG